MRKWMNDRLKRRKKSDKGPSGPAKAQEPLQPKYFENDIDGNRETEAPHSIEQAPEPIETRAEAKPRDTERREPEPMEQEEPSSVRATGDAAVADEAGKEAGNDESGRPVRRRRRRGGRPSTRRSPNPKPAPADSVDAAPIAVVTEAPLTPDIVGQDAASIPLLTVEPPSADTVAAELPPTVAVPAAPRPSKGTVVLAIGLPGSGKSSWFKRHNIRPLSSDLLRELLFDDSEEQRFQDLVFSNLRSMLKARLIARRPVSYVDATNLTPQDRHSWIKLAKDYGYEVQGLFFDVPLEVCLERHARRGRVVPEDIMRKMSAKLKAPTFEEGFSKIIVVRVKKKE
ncbi:MAG: AAA family ATPase [Terriglobales bacterium]|jgi:predicted kinase